MLDLDLPALSERVTIPALYLSICDNNGTAAFMLSQMIVAAQLHPWDLRAAVAGGCIASLAYWPVEMIEAGYAVLVARGYVREYGGSTTYGALDVHKVIEAVKETQGEH